ncbi:MAG TPA: hypothetical protein VIA08_04775 [Nitrososphaeraceae archaeon]
MNKNNTFELGRSITKVLLFHRKPITAEKQKQQLKEKAKYLVEY